MELIYLLISILTTFITSLFLSVILPFRRRRRPPPAVTLYKGTVFHERRRPVHHSFSYSVRYALFDLDRSSSTPSGHISADEARRVTHTTGNVFLLTIPPSVGYEQNPLNVYYCYDPDGSSQILKKCIAEVTNTPWGERVSFVFDPNSDVVVKALHVSPFMDMLGIWNIRANSPGDNLFVEVSVKHPDHGDHFLAILRAKRVPSSLVSNYALFFWLMPHRVAVWIYWHAFKLWWKGVPFVQHPRYADPSYRQEALARDQKLKCGQAIPGENSRRRQADESTHTGLTLQKMRICCPSEQVKGKCLQLEENDTAYLLDKSCGVRWFSWKDAKWPWS